MEWETNNDLLNLLRSSSSSSSSSDSSSSSSDSDHGGGKKSTKIKVRSTKTNNAGNKDPGPSTKSAKTRRQTTLIRENAVRKSNIKINQDIKSESMTARNNNKEVVAKF